LSRRTRSAGSADVGCQVLIGRDEFFPARLDVVGFTASEVRGEVLGVDLPAGSEERDLVQGHTSNLEDEDCLVAIRGQRDLFDRVEGRDALPLTVGLIGFPGRYHEPPRWFARVDAAGAVDVIGFEVEAELSAGVEIALDLAVPAGQADGIGDRRPEVVDVGLVAVFDSDTPAPSADRRLPRMRVPGLALLVMSRSFVRVFLAPPRYAGRPIAAPTETGSGQARPYGVPGASLVSWRGLPSGLARR
jgi:hypothetical protein